jgi:hypothetical protein
MPAPSVAYPLLYILPSMEEAGGEREDGRRIETVGEERTMTGNGTRLNGRSQCALASQPSCGQRRTDGGRRVRRQTVAFEKPVLAPLRRRV